jgi:ParB-like chromosome segregation protein Spo0J
MTDDDTDLHDDVTIRPLNDIVPYGENPKEHPQEQVDKIASSIRRFGWDQPIVVDGDGTIIKGHGRYQAAQKLGLMEVPVIEQLDLSDAEARAARIADNRVAESEWNDDLLAVELELVEESDMPIETTAFDESESGEYLDPPDLEVPDEFDEIDEEDIEFEHECPECGYQW